jgi:hypothetical protein
MPRKKATVDASALNPNAELPFELRLKDFEMAMQDVYDFFTTSTSSCWAKAFIEWTTCCDRQPCQA